MFCGFAALFSGAVDPAETRWDASGIQVTLGLVFSAAVKDAGRMAPA
jgi:hypothetical protein